MFRRLMERKAAEEEAARKKTQIRRKRKMAAVALVAVFMMALGFTAIGEKSYFFRRTEEGDNHLIMYNDSNKIVVGKLEEAYSTVEQTFNIKMPRLGYRPEELKFETLNISGDTAIIVFEYDERKIYFIQEYQDTQTSRGTTSDRKDIDKVHNKWMQMDVIIDGNQLNSQETEYGAQFNIGNYIYRFCGIMDKEEFKQIIENIYFFK